MDAKHPKRHLLLDTFIGRNGFDSPAKLLKEQCVEALNIDWYGSTFARKRGGATALATTGGTAFSGVIASLFRHVPTSDDTAAEFWGIDSTAFVKRLQGGTAWANVTLDDAIASRPQDVNATTFNGKLFLCYGVSSNASTDTTSAATAGTNYTVGAGVIALTVKAWGAAGGADGGDGSKAGGGGGFATAVIPVTPGETLSKRVGGGGARSGQTFQGGGGGGYTGLFRGSVPLIIAPGGGGAGFAGVGGVGGGTTGGRADGSTTNGPNGWSGGTGGSQSAGGGAGDPTASVSIDYLIVGGGGNGGSNSGGGGGGGQVLSGTDAVTLGQSLSIVVGAAGAASTYNGHSAAGGTDGVGGAGAGGSSGSGNPGGAGAGCTTFGDGGGGAGDANIGGPADCTTGGNGGAGTVNALSGASVEYGSGGGGGGASVGPTTGGTATGGGGAGGGNASAGTAATANTGAGGGGGGSLASGGAGATGIVIVRYLNNGTVFATGGSAVNSGQYTIRTFTSNGTLLVGPVPATAGASLQGGNGMGWLSGGAAGAAGGTNGGGTGGAHGTATTFRSGGGGGGGFFGGGGGGADQANDATGGGGGSCFLSGSSTRTESGSGATPGGTSDPDWNTTAGKGGNTSAGADGLLVIHAVSPVDRLHVYDPNLATPRVRRVGLLATVAPTVANTGAGAYPATLRYYRQRTIQLDALTSVKVIRRSEPSPSVSFTPSGGGTAARVTRGAFPGEGETHWEIEASTDNITFYRLAQVVIGTTTYDDSAATSTYSSNPVSDLTGTYALPTAVKGIVATASRLLIAGSYAVDNGSAGKNNRVWWTPVLGSSDQGDDERIPTTLVSYTDLSENAGDTFVGFSDPIWNGTVFVFFQREIWRLTPSGDPSAPFITRQVSDIVGAINQKSICTGEDEAGQPCIYFASYLGYYRISSRYGVQYIGRDLEDRWYGLSGQTAVNLTAANMVGHAKWHQGKHQVWFWQATDSNPDPDTKFMFDPQLGRTITQGEVRGGWAVHTGPSCQARCSALFSNTVGATMSRDLKPHVGYTGSTTILKCDTTDTTDNGTAFQAFLLTGPLTDAAGDDGKIDVTEPELQAVAVTPSGGGAPTTITLTLIADYDAVSAASARQSTVVLTPLRNESRVVKKFEGAATGEATNIQIQIGDGSALGSAWNLDALMVPISYAGQK